MTAPTLAEFLLARIADDEARAETTSYYWNEPPDADDRIETHHVDLSTHVRAQCAAMRAIVEECSFEEDRATLDSPEGDLARFVLATLAEPYADHPDYRDEWRP